MSRDNHHVNTQKQALVESVLILQAGGSLGAYECGVFKSLAKHNIWFDIVAGTSIGSVNASVIVDSLRNKLQNKKKGTENTNNSNGSTDKDKHAMLIETACKLEEYWLSTTDNIVPNYVHFKVRSYISAANTFTFGHPIGLNPIWFYPGNPLLNNALASPYLYDTAQFKQTLRERINFENLISTQTHNNNNLQENNFSSPRLILASTDIQKGEPVIFDTNAMDITAEHISACIAYPFYGLKWENIGKKYLWDGSILGGSPLKAVMRSSPFKEKVVIDIDLFPRYQERLPNNFAETWHRARDILFLDKSHPEIEESDNLREIYPLLEEMHDIITDNFDNTQNKKLKDRLKQMENKYNSIIDKRGKIIKELIKIKRNEGEKSHHSLFEDWDFSIQTIKELIKQGEEDAESALQKRENPNSIRNNEVFIK
jgi:NTE family protein